MQARIFCPPSALRRRDRRHAGHTHSNGTPELHQPHTTSFRGVRQRAAENGRRFSDRGGAGSRPSDLSDLPARRNSSNYRQQHPPPHRVACHCLQRPRNGPRLPGTTSVRSVPGTRPAVVFLMGFGRSASRRTRWLRTKPNPKCRTREGTWRHESRKETIN